MLERAFILEEVWGYDFPTTANSLEVYVGYLRRKTEAEGESRLLHTVRGVGYVLRETRRDAVVTAEPRPHGALAPAVATAHPAGVAGHAGLHPHVPRRRA